MDFLDPSSVLITIGGVICATAASFPPKRLIKTLKAVALVFKKNKVDLSAI
jgi:flagellar motor component MotA